MMRAVSSSPRGTTQIDQGASRALSLPLSVVKGGERRSCSIKPLSSLCQETLVLYEASVKAL
jgi:hypothetical protein